MSQNMVTRCVLVYDKEIKKIPMLGFFLFVKHIVFKTG